MASLHSSLRRDFNETVTVKQKTSSTAYGVPSYDAGTQYSARWIQADTMIRRNDGENIRADGLVWIAPDDNGNLPSFTPDDTIILPDGSNWPVLIVETYNDGHQLDHVKVFYGRIRSG